MRLRLPVCVKALILVQLVSAAVPTPSMARGSNCVDLLTRWVGHVVASTMTGPATYATLLLPHPLDRQKRLRNWFLRFGLYSFMSLTTFIAENRATVTQGEFQRVIDTNLAHVQKEGREERILVIDLVSSSLDSLAPIGRYHEELLKENAGSETPLTRVVAKNLAELRLQLARLRPSDSSRFNRVEFVAHGMPGAFYFSGDLPQLGLEEDTKLNEVTAKALMASKPWQADHLIEPGAALHLWSCSIAKASDGTSEEPGVNTSGRLLCAGDSMSVELGRRLLPNGGHVVAATKIVRMGGVSLVEAVAYGAGLYLPWQAFKFSVFHGYGVFEERDYIDAVDAKIWELSSDGSIIGQRLVE